MEEGKYETAARFVFNEKGIRFSTNCGAASVGKCKTSTCIWIYQLSYNISYFTLHYKIKWTSQRDAKTDILVISPLSERILLARD